MYIICLHDAPSIVYYYIINYNIYGLAGWLYEQIKIMVLLQHFIKTFETKFYYLTFINYPAYINIINYNVKKIINDYALFSNKYLHIIGNDIVILYRISLNVCHFIIILHGSLVRYFNDEKDFKIP